jgi:hypothetical protein
MSALSRRGSQSAPRRASVGADLAGSASLLEHLERRTNSALELRFVNRIELLLGVVQIVEIDRLDAEI